MKYLILGNGYVGNYLSDVLPDCTLYKEKVFDVQDVKNLLRDQYPSHCLINCAGTIGKPNVDWCEDNKQKTVEGNVMLPLTIAVACLELKRYWVHIGSGCVYCGYDKPWTEEDEANFRGSFYSMTKAWSQQMLEDFDQVCTLRIRMPIDERMSPRSYIGKILKYAREGKKLFSIPNSMTVLSDLAEAIVFLTEKGHTGTWNVVNRGAAETQEILDMYREFVDGRLKYELASVEEVEAGLKAGRSNCVLSTTKLEKAGCVLPELKERLLEIMRLAPRKNNV